MRTIITLALGIYIGRQIYIQWDKETAKQKEKVVKKKLISFLNDKVEGFSSKEETEKVVETERKTEVETEQERKKKIKNEIHEL